MSNTIFRCRIKVFDLSLIELAVFVWELEPLDEQTRSVREWVAEYMWANCENLLPALGIKGSGGWEAVFVATIRAFTCGPDQELDESVELIKWQVQPLPSEMFE